MLLLYESIYISQFIYESIHVCTFTETTQKQYLIFLRRLPKSNYTRSWKNKRHTQYTTCINVDYINIAAAAQNRSKVTYC